MSRGIRDAVAIVGMGCTRFGERWESSAEDLMIDAWSEALTSAAIDAADVGGYWLGTMGSAAAGLGLSRALRMGDRPVTRVENLCATGSEALRAAVYAVASGAFDTAMALGVEKLKDSGFSGLVTSNPPSDGADPKYDFTGPGNFSVLAPAYAEKYGLTAEEMREVLARIAWKNHRNGALNPRAQFRAPVSLDAIKSAPVVAGMLRVFDCSGVSDGAASALVVPAERAYDYTDKPVFVKGLSVVSGAATGHMDESFDFTTFPEVTRSAADAYAQAGVSDPARQIAFAEVHDCFTPTELVLMEDLGFSPRGCGWRDVLEGRFELAGELPINPDGGLKAFGHPIGASGLRMVFECWQQFRGEAAERQIERATQPGQLALTHNLGGGPGEAVSFVGVFGNSLDQTAA